MMGQVVPIVKEYNSQEFEAELRHLPPMPTENDQARFNDELCARVKMLRERKGWSAMQMSVALNVPFERYRKYENRTVLPSYLFERFCLITGVSLEYLLTGRDAAASKTQRRTG